MNALYWLVAGLAAWYASPWLISVLSFLPIKEFIDAITPRNVFSRDGSFYMTFLVSMVLFWAIFKTFGFTFLFSGPQSYGNTAPVRQIRGGLAEIAVFLVFGTPILALLVLSGVGKVLVLDGMERERGRAFVDTAAAPLRNEVYEAERRIAGNNSQQGTLKIEQKWEEFKDWFRAPENKGQGTSRVQEKMERLNTRTGDLVRERDGAVTELHNLTEAYARGDGDVVRRAREAVWQDLTANRWQLLFQSVRHLWWLVLPLGVPFYVMWGPYVRMAIGTAYKPVRRFLDQGRMGQGGSSRFAGLLEEWELAYPRRKS